MNATIKHKCEECGFLVKTEGHAERCRPAKPRVESWCDERVAAWYGDSIQRIDVQLALKFLNVPHEQWGIELSKYTKNEAMAVYMRMLGSDDRSDHTLGTAFECRYVGRFREVYLRRTFPDVCERVLAAWQPPVIEVDVATFIDVGL